MFDERLVSQLDLFAQPSPETASRAVARDFASATLGFIPLAEVGEKPVHQGH